MSAPETAQIFYKTFTVLTAAVAFSFYFLYQKNRLVKDFRSEASMLSLVVVCGTLVRLLIAWHGYGNYDGRSWEIAADAAARGANVYAETERYQYTPLWFWVLGALKRLHQVLPGISFGGLVRIFLTFADLATLGVLAAIARQRKLPALQVALFFYLNPVSFLLTGYHGQFENLALLVLLAGVWGEKKRGWLWAFSSLGMWVKHNIFYEVLAALRHRVKDLRAVAGLFLISCAVFAALFLPYWETGKEGIIRNVLFYSSYPMDYGVSTFFRWDWLKWIFVAGLFVYPLTVRTTDLVQRLLLSALFFLVFTTGFGNQYLILPIALASLRPSRGFFIYTIAATLFLLGDQKNLGIPLFSWIPLNLVWASAAFWWVVEARRKDACLSPSQVGLAGRSRGL